MCIKPVASTKRKVLLGLVTLSLLAMVSQRLIVGTGAKESATAKGDSGGQQVSTTVWSATSPDFTFVQTDLLTTAESVSRFDHSGTVAQQHALASKATELAARCDSLLHSEAGAIELRQVVRRWAESEGPAAAAWAAQSTHGLAQAEVLTEVALGWGKADWPAALEWANTLPEGNGRETVIEQLGYETARTDALEALAVAVSLEPGGKRDDLLEHAISQWAIKDFAAAVQWAETGVSDEDLRQRLLAAVAVAVAGQDGAAAATLTAKALTPGDEQDRVAIAIVQRWVQTEPEQAAAWVAQFPDTPARGAAVQNLVAFWAAQDQQAASNWLQGLPEGTLRDAGMAAYSQALATTEIVAAE